MRKHILYALVIAFGICMTTGCGKETESLDASDNKNIQAEKESDEKEDIKEIEDNEDDNNITVPEYYATYADLLQQFMNGDNAYYMNNDHAVSYVEQDGVSFSQYFSFGLNDLNKDGIEELIIVNDSIFSNGGSANILIPNEKWEKANMGEISYVDINSGKVASLISDLGDVVTYYGFNGSELVEYDCYHYYMHESGDEGKNKYYHGKDDNGEITEEEYNKQDAFHWNSLDIPFYFLSEVNIDFVLRGKLLNVENEDWKQAYIPIVKQWDVVHGVDFNYGYELVYIDDNDVPELILECDDDASCGYDIYTCIDGKAVHLKYEDESMNQKESNLISPGCQAKGDAYIEKTGIYMLGVGHRESYGSDGYVLKGDMLKHAFKYQFFDNSWDETISNPYGYTIEYFNSNGEKITKDVVTDGDEKYYDIAGAPEAEEIEKIYNCDFKKSKSVNCSMNYKTICSMLGMDNDSINMSDKEKYASLLYQYIKDDTKIIREDCDTFSYLNDGGKFMLNDINNDGVDEMLLTVLEREYNVFVPGDNWEESNVGNITAYSDDGILEREYGETFTHCYAYYTLEDNEFRLFDIYSSYNNEDTFITMEYTHRLGDNPDTAITEAEFYAGDGLYGVHSVEGTWYDISEENINRILLQENNEAVSTQADEIRYVTTAANDGGVNMRFGPGTEYDIVVEMIPNGEKMAVNDEALSTTGKTWYKVIYHGMEGWVAASQVK